LTFVIFFDRIVHRLAQKRVKFIK